MCAADSYKIEIQFSKLNSRPFDVLIVRSLADFRLKLGPGRVAPQMLREPVRGDPSTPLRSTQDDINVIEILKGLPFGCYAILFREVRSTSGNFAVASLPCDQYETAFVCKW